MKIDINSSMNATEKFLAIVMNASGCNREQAIHVLKVYRNRKILRFDVNGAGPIICHGAFYDSDVLWHAINAEIKK